MGRVKGAAVKQAAKRGHIKRHVDHSSRTHCSMPHTPRRPSPPTAHPRFWTPAWLGWLPPSSCGPPAWRPSHPLQQVGGWQESAVNTKDAELGSMHTGVRSHYYRYKHANRRRLTKQVQAQQPTILIAFLFDTCACIHASNCKRLQMDIGSPSPSSLAASFSSAIISTLTSCA